MKKSLSILSVILVAAMICLAFASCSGMKTVKFTIDLHGEDEAGKQIPADYTSLDPSVIMKEITKYAEVSDVSNIYLCDYLYTETGGSAPFYVRFTDDFYIQDIGFEFAVAHSATNVHIYRSKFSDSIMTIEKVREENTNENCFTFLLGDILKTISHMDWTKINNYLDTSDYYYFEILDDSQTVSASNTYADVTNIESAYESITVSASNKIDVLDTSKLTTKFSGRFLHLTVQGQALSNSAFAVSAGETNVFVTTSKYTG